MSKDRIRELLDDPLIRSAFLFLLSTVFALVSWNYSQVSGDFEKRITAIEGREREIDATLAARGERLRALEESSNHLKEDIGRLRDDVRTLIEKIDRLAQLLFDNRKASIVSTPA